MTEQNTAPPVTDRKPRCWRCDRVLAEVATRPWCIRCHKCKANNGSPKED